MPAAARPLLAALAAVVLFANDGHAYTTKLSQGSDALWTPGDSFSIRDGQCSRDYDDKLVCPDGLPPDGALVVVSDNNDFADISLSADFRHGTVTRAPPCDGGAAVSLKLACQFNRK